MIDPITLSVIPDDRAVLVTEGAGEWYMDALVLLKNVLLFDNSLNPLTRTPLSNEVLTCLDKYRVTQLKLVIVVDKDAAPLSKKRMTTLTFNSFDTVGDVIAAVSTWRDKGKCIASIAVLNDGKSLYTHDLDTELGGFERVTTMYVQNTILTDSEYSRIKEYVGKYDRFKHKFSPFPEHIKVIEGVAHARTDRAVSRYRAPSLMFGQYQRQENTWSMPVLSDIPSVLTIVPEQRTMSRPNTTPVLTTTERSTLVDLLKSIATPDGVTWQPLCYESADWAGCWSVWELVTSDSLGVLGVFSPDYRYHPMPTELVDYIERYRSDGSAGDCPRSLSRVTFTMDRIHRGETLPPPVTRELMSTLAGELVPMSTLPSVTPAQLSTILSNTTPALTATEESMLVNLLKSIATPDRHTWYPLQGGFVDDQGCWSRWGLVTMNFLNNFPTAYRLHPMPIELVWYINDDRAHRLGERQQIPSALCCLTYHDVVGRGLPLPQPVTVELMSTLSEGQVHVESVMIAPEQYYRPFSDPAQLALVQSDTTPALTTSEESMLVDLFKSIATPDGVTWCPFSASRVDESGCWSAWGLTTMECSGSFPRDYRYHPMPPDLVDYIVRYRSGDRSGDYPASLSGLARGRAYNGLLLPQPVTAELMSTLSVNDSTVTASDAIDSPTQPTLTVTSRQVPNPRLEELVNRVQQKVATTDGYTWRYDAGQWILVHLRDAQSYPVDYQPVPMSLELIESINNYNTTGEVWYPIVDSTYYRTIEGLPLPSPITVEVMSEVHNVEVSMGRPRHNIGPEAHNTRENQSVVRMIQQKVATVDGYTWRYDAGQWTLVHLRDAQSYPVDYEPVPMSLELIESINKYNRTGGAWGEEWGEEWGEAWHPVNESVYSRVSSRLPLPSPITVEVMSEVHNVEVSTAPPRWYPVFHSGEGLYEWDVFCTDTPPSPPRQYSGEVMDEELVSAIRNHTSHPRIGINAREMVRRGWPPLPAVHSQRATPMGWFPIHRLITWNDSNLYMWEVCSVDTPPSPPREYSGEEMDEELLVGIRESVSQPEKVLIDYGWRLGPRARGMISAGNAAQLPRVRT